MVSGPDISADAVLGPIKGHQVHLRRLVENVDGGTDVPVYTRGVGDQAHAFALQFLEAVALQHFQAGEHRVYLRP